MENKRSGPHLLFFSTKAFLSQLALIGAGASASVPKSATTTFLAGTDVWTEPRRRHQPEPPAEDGAGTGSRELGAHLLLEPARGAIVYYG